MNPRFINACWGAMLFCNVLALGIVLAKHDAGFIQYLNLLGCVIFGAWVSFTLTDDKL